MLVGIREARQIGGQRHERMQGEAAGGRTLTGDSGFEQTAVPVGIALQAVRCKLIAFARSDQAQMGVGVQQGVPEPDITACVVRSIRVPDLPGAVQFVADFP